MVFSNFFFLTFLLWPLVTIGSSLLNMAIWGKFHWAEPFIMAPLAGMGIGAAAWWALQPGPGGAVGFVRGLITIMSHGVFGIVRLAGPLGDPLTFFCWSAGAVVLCTILAAAIDHAASAIGPTGAGAVALGIFTFLLKAPFCLISTVVGLLIFIVGAIHAAASSNAGAGWAGGVSWEEWSKSAGGNVWATTVGATVHCWQGPITSVFEHEMHHTRQCIYFHDWMIPSWVIGEIGHAATGQNNGNPLENVPYQIQ